MGIVGSVRELRRYPVKSTVGGTLRSAQVDGRGVVGDRTWAVRDPDGKLGSGKSTRRFRRMDRLLELISSYHGAGLPVVTFPDGRSLDGDDPAVHRALSAHVGRPVELRCEAEVPHHDEGPMHLVSTATLASLEELLGRAVDVRRLRPNLLVDVAAQGVPEHDWVGCGLAIGPHLVLRVRGTMPRCVMVDLPQAGLPGDGALLRLLTDTTDMNLGVVADVLAPGPVTVGDAVRLLEP